MNEAARPRASNPWRADLRSPDVRNTGGQVTGIQVTGAQVTGVQATSTRTAGTSATGDTPLPGDRGDAVLVRRIRPARALAIATALLIVAVLLGVAIGPAGMSIPQVLDTLAVRLPWHPRLAVSALDTAIVWQIRLPRVILGLLVGSMLAGGGAAYQGVFRNPLADPYLLGVAAGAGLGATIVIVSGANTAFTPPAAFAGAVVAVALTYALGAGAGRRGGTPGARSGTGSILLAGIAVAAMLTALQTYLQEEHTQILANVYAWILGGLSAATWSDVWLILPYVAVSAVALLVHRRLLDVLRVGEDEAATLGVNVARLRLAVVMAATLGVAAAVAVSGLIGFVGIIVPHAVRLTAGPSYRVLLPVSMIGGAAFVVLADVVARTAQAPAEVPIGVITALIGGPFFLFVLSSRRARQDL
ncbi:MAG TPA: iron ABC transporter permease [Streptosporangiaceae bacterium]|nr:iron ABC transporter permease [Streptosporangiaceae bacterium]